MTAFQHILINTERWNETVVTPSLAKPHELICTPNTYFATIYFNLSLDLLLNVFNEVLLCFISYFIEKL